MFPKYWILLAVFTVACDDGSTKDPAGAGGGGGETPDAAPPTNGLEGELVASRKARVKFKGGERALGDLAAALDLDRAEACKELGIYDCVTEVHRIALGGVEPYTLRINDPLEVIPVTAAIAADRVALVACGQRVSADFESPENAKVFKALATGTADAATLAETVGVLYDRILQRPATQPEIDALVALHADVVAEEGGDGSAMWAKLSCFAVATTLEALFF